MVQSLREAKIVGGSRRSELNITVAVVVRHGSKNSTSITYFINADSMKLLSSHFIKLRPIKTIELLVHKRSNSFGQLPNLRGIRRRSGKIDRPRVRFPLQWGWSMAFSERGYIKNSEKCENNSSSFVRIEIFEVK